MAPSVFGVLLQFVILGLLLASAKRQGYGADSRNLYYSVNHHDPFYNLGYGQRGFNPYPDPAVYSPNAYPYPNSYRQQTVSTSNYHSPNPTPNYDTPYNNPTPNYNSHYYNSNPYPIYAPPSPGYIITTDVPITTTTPESAASTSGWGQGVGGGDGQEVDEGTGPGVSRGGSPVFNPQAFLGPQRALPAWPFQTMRNNINSPSGRLYLLPPAVGGQGLLEAVSSVQRHRQQQALRSFNNRNNLSNLATNPLFLMLAFNGF